MRRQCGIAAFVILFVGLAAPKAYGGASPVEAGNVGPPTVREIAGATLTGFEGIDGPVTLVSGRWQGEPVAPGSVSRPGVVLLPGPHQLADMDGDGVDEFVAMLSSSTGGSGVFLHMAVVARRDDALANLATVMVGDRVQVRGARTDGGAVVLDLVQLGDGDAMCCPGDLSTRAWRLVDGVLVESSSEVTGRLAPAAMGDGEWRLLAWTLEERAPAEPVVTLRYQEDGLYGKSGCNSYMSMAVAGEKAGDVTIGPIGGTRMMCTPEAMEVEQRFLGQLRGLERFGFMNGRLALSYAMEDGSSATMLFVRR